jgi:adenylyltransferase/sulfurtransferase
VGVVGTLQACEALKLLADIGTSMHGRLMLVDALGMEIRTLGLPAEADCPVCATRRA